MDALTSDDPDDVVSWCRTGAEAAVIDTNLDRALSGNRAAAFGYVRAWRSLADAVLAPVHFDVTGTAAPTLRIVLDATAMEAPFSAWVARTGQLGVGACAALVAKIRETIPGLAPITVASQELPGLDRSETQLGAFHRNVIAALAESELPLERIMSVFDVTVTDVGRMFGVSRQAVAQWRESGVPGDRQEKIATVAAVADLLASRLKTGHIPGVVRRPADAYDGRTALEMIEADRHDELLDRIRESFDWARPA